MTFVIPRLQMTISIMFVLFSVTLMVTTGISNGQIEDPASSNTTELSTDRAKANDLLQNPLFNSINKTTGIPSYWDDAFDSCIRIFQCDINSDDGWPAKQSLQLSTQNNTDSTWSWISSESIEVEPDENYEISSHMKLNEWAAGSHIVLEGFNETSQEWYQIEQCPSGTNGPLNWTEYNCRITIPPQTSSLLVVLNAGWSSEKGRDAVTSFDAIHVFKVT